jgi:hypothetical protein
MASCAPVVYRRRSVFHAINWRVTNPPQVANLPHNNVQF